jgi:hypothetical protein
MKLKVGLILVTSSPRNTPILMPIHIQTFSQKQVKPHFSYCLAYFIIILAHRVNNGGINPMSRSSRQSC